MTYFIPDIPDFLPDLDYEYFCNNTWHPGISEMQHLCIAEGWPFRARQLDHEQIKAEGFTQILGDRFAYGDWLLFYDAAEAGLLLIDHQHMARFDGCCKSMAMLRLILQLVGLEVGEKQRA